MALSQAQIEELNKQYAGATSSKGVYGGGSTTNDDKLKSDADYRTSEIERAKKVMDERTSQGLDVKDQQTYLDKINTYNQPVAEPQNDIPSMQQQLLDAQRKATVASLDKARNQSMLALQQEESAVAPQYAQQRSQARTTSELGAKGFSDFMAQRGLASSGGAALGETQRLGALQGALGGLQQQEQDVLANIGARRTGIEQGYQSDLASAEANIQAQAMQNAIAQAQADKVAQEQATALERQQFMDTVGQYASNYQGQINTVLGDNDPANDWQADILGAARQQKIANQGLDQQGNAIPQGLSFTPSQALSLWSTLGKATPEIAAALGIQEGQEYSTFASRNKSYGGGSYGGGGTITPTLTNVETPVPNITSGLGAEPELGSSKAYTDIAQGLFGPSSMFKADESKTKGQKIYDYLNRDGVYKTLVEQIGIDGVEQMKAEAMQLSQQESQPASEDELLNSAATALAQMQDPIADLMDNKAEYIERLGLDGYNKLLKAYGIN